MRRTPRYRRFCRLPPDDCEIRRRSILFLGPARAVHPATLRPVHPCRHTRARARVHARAERGTGVRRRVHVGICRPFRPREWDRQRERDRLSKQAEKARRRTVATRCDPTGSSGPVFRVCAHADARTDSRGCVRVAGAAAVGGLAAGRPDAGHACIDTARSALAWVRARCESRGGRCMEWQRAEHGPWRS